MTSHTAILHLFAFGFVFKLGNTNKQSGSDLFFHAWLGMFNFNIVLKLFSASAVLVSLPESPSSTSSDFAVYFLAIFRTFHKVYLNYGCTGVNAKKNKI